MEILKAISTSKFFSRYGLEYSWVSGSSTIVHPITWWKASHTIEVQLDSFNNQSGVTLSAKALAKEINKTSGKEVITDTKFLKYDGSCPNIIVFILNKDYDESDN